MAQPEHALQSQCVKFCRECILTEHVFLAFDRSKKQSALQHIREKARGIRAGTPDILILVPGLAIWAELKAGKNTASDLQEEVGAAIVNVGHRWEVVRSVEELRRYLNACGVALYPRADLRALDLDLVLKGAAMKAKGPKSYVPQKPRAAKPTQRAIARTNALRAKVFF